MSAFDPKRTSANHRSTLTNFYPLITLVKTPVLAHTWPYRGLAYK
jgi:hypothetical protein